MFSIKVNYNEYTDQTVSCCYIVLHTSWCVSLYTIFRHIIDILYPSQLSSLTFTKNFNLYDVIPNTSGRTLSLKWTTKTPLDTWYLIMSNNLTYPSSTSHILRNKDHRQILSVPFMRGSLDLQLLYWLSPPYKYIYLSQSVD